MAYGEKRIQRKEYGKKEKLAVIIMLRGNGKRKEIQDEIIGTKMNP